jgi:adenine deaminase
MLDYIEGNIVDIHTDTIYPAKITVNHGIIIDITKNNGHYNEFIIPGLVDSHVHIESSLLIPSRFAEIAVTHGTIAVVSDPHEIANVCGLEGIKFMIDNGKTTPFIFSFGAPSSVPSTIFESNGAIIGPSEINTLFKKFKLNYLSEVMNYPGVINGDIEIIRKLNIARKFRKKIDGHAPEVKGISLKQYAKYGIETDHECSNIDEAIEKINLGIKILIREGSAANNFEELSPLIDLYPSKVMLCTDDFHADLLLRFHINELIKRGLKKGLNLFNLLRAASLNPKDHYNLPIGLLRVNESADFAIIDNLTDFNIIQTWIKGIAVFSNSKVHFKSKRVKIINNFKVEPITYDQLAILPKGNKIQVINLIEGELITLKSIENAKIVNNEVISDIANDILKLVVINRYKRKAIPVICFVKNFGLKSGAIASSISHDSHNIIAVGTNDEDLLSSINKLISNKGGLIATSGNSSVLLTLEIAGLMSQKSISIVSTKLNKLNNLVKSFGCKLKSPFMTLSFLSLIVIPHLKLSDKGLFDVDSFSFTDLFVE